jgi:glycine reductase
MTMKLELRVSLVKDIQFGNRTILQDGVLTVNREELGQFLESDRRFERVDIALTSPGDSCRIFQVVDVMEPRVKRGSSVQDIQRLPVPSWSIGTGETCVLRGAAVVLVDERAEGKNSTASGVRDQIIDMSGPASEISIYGKTHNIVLLPRQKEKSNILEYQAALKIAEIKTAAYLARAANNVVPDEIETYELPSLMDLGGSMPGLPKVVYIFQMISFQYQPIPGEPTFFGVQVEGITPTLLHPNQILDGAVTSALPTLNIQTYQIQNHPIIKELYRRHGKDLCFSGVIGTAAPNNVQEMDCMAGAAAGMAKWIIGADGAVLTKTGGGAPELALAKTAQQCEQLGVKTAIAMLHMGADIRDSKYSAATIFNFPEVDAIVSMGFPSREIRLPPVKKVLGRAELLGHGISADSEMMKSIGTVQGALCQVGSSRFTAVRY